MVPSGVLEPLHAPKARRYPPEYFNPWMQKLTRVRACDRSAAATPGATRLRMSDDDVKEVAFGDGVFTFFGLPYDRMCVPSMYC
jgi:hypothetical protein